MTKTFFLALFLMVALTRVSAQDVIIKRTNEEILAKVTEVSVTEVKFKRFDNQNGPLYTLLKSEIAKIRYENGTIDSFKIEYIPQTYTQNNSFNSELFLQGQTDAIKYYKGQGAGFGTFAATTLTLYLGLIPAIACSSTPPRDNNLNYPNPDLMKNFDYNRGYTQKAYKIKKRNTWTGFGIGAISFFVLYSQLVRY